MPKLLIPLAAALLLLTACQQEGKSDRGMRYMPDMFDSNALESQDAFYVAETNPDGTVQELEVPIVQPPVDGTLSRDFVPHASDDPDQGRNLVNPLPRTADVLQLGQTKFNIYCAVCHGKDGNVANGYVASKLTGVISINTENVAGMPDGHVYHIITHGRNRMPGYAAQLLPEERWAVIHYLRALYEAANADTEAKAAYQARQATDDRFVPQFDPLPEYQREVYRPAAKEAGQ